MNIDFYNRHTIENIYTHDGVFEKMVYDYTNRKITFNCTQYYFKKAHSFVFNNVISCNIQSCNFWGEGARIMNMYYEDSDSTLKCLYEHKHYNPNWGYSYLDEDIKYLSICFEINSGDTLQIICESMEHQEIKLDSNNLS